MNQQFKISSLFKYSVRWNFLMCLLLLSILPALSSCRVRVSPVTKMKTDRLENGDDHIFVTSIGVIDSKLKALLTDELSTQLQSKGMSLKHMDFVLTTVVRGNGILTESVPTFFISTEDLELRIGTIVPASRAILLECAFDDGIDDHNTPCDLKHGREVVGKSNYAAQVQLLEFCSGPMQSVCKLAIEFPPQGGSAFKLGIQPRAVFRQP